jgi:hypothetical protein
MNRQWSVVSGEWSVGGSQGVKREGRTMTCPIGCRLFEPKLTVQAEA